MRTLKTDAPMKQVNPNILIATEHKEFSLRHAYCFMVLAGCGSFSTAANTLNISVSGLSRILSDLECKTGEQLFERLAHGIRLNSAGLAFLHFAQLLVEKYSQGLEAVKSMPSDSFTLACTESLSGTILTLQSRGQDTQNDFGPLCLQVLGGHQVVSSVVLGIADIGVCLLPEPIEGIAHETLLDVSLGLLTSNGIVIRSTIRKIDDLEGYQFVRLAEDLVLPEFLHKKNILMPAYFNASITCNGMASLLSILNSGEYCTIAPKVVTCLPSSKNLQFFSLDHLLPPMKLMLIWRKENQNQLHNWWREKIGQHVLNQLRPCLSGKCSNK